MGTMKAFRLLLVRRHGVRLLQNIFVSLQHIISRERGEEKKATMRASFKAFRVFVRAQPTPSYDYGREFSPRAVFLID
jgi:hypothetical protein